MPNVHVNESMAIGHYSPKVTFENEKFRPLTGEQNKEVVPDTQLPEFSLVDLNNDANRICGHNWLPDYIDKALVTYDQQALIDGKHSKSGWKLFFYQDKRVVMNCSLGNGVVRCFDTIETFTVTWKKISSFGMLSLGAYAFRMAFPYVLFEGLDPATNAWTPVMPYGVNQYIWLPSDSSLMASLNEATQQFRFRLDSTAVPAGSHNISILFSGLITKRPDHGKANVSFWIQICP